MKAIWSLAGFTLTLFACSHALKAAPAPLAGVPIYVMEYHVWWQTPYGRVGQPKGWDKWNWYPYAQLDRAIGPSWRRDVGSADVPLIGPYDSADPDVMRWQLRCAKAAGITALQVSLFPSMRDGYQFKNEELFAKMLLIAAEEKMPICLHDEVQFRKPPANLPDVMAERLIRFLNRYVQSPGYYKRNGKPMVSFQYWNRFMSSGDLTRMVTMVYKGVPGGVDFMINGAPDQWLQYVEGVGSVIGTSNMSLEKEYQNRALDLNWLTLESQLKNLRPIRATIPGKQLGLWVHPGFDNAAQTAGKGRYFSRGEQLSSMRDTISRYVKEKPDFILVSSWNDWNENTAIEPALDVDGYNGDPYQALRLIAELQSKTFTPPPLPPFEAMDPWMTAYHKGPDHTPPRIGNVWVSPNQSAVRFDLIDETSPIGKFAVARTPALAVAWPGGHMEAIGFKTDNETSGIGQKEGRFGKNLSEGYLLNIPAGLLSGKEKVWLAVTIWDEKGGDEPLKIAYPVNPPTRYQPSPELDLPREIRLGLKGEQKWRTLLFALEDLDLAAARQVITFRPVKPDEVVLLGAVSLFRESDMQSNNLMEIGSTSDHESVTVLARNMTWDPNVIRHYLLGGEDTHGNKMFPRAIDVGLSKFTAPALLPAE